MSAQKGLTLSRFDIIDWINDTLLLNITNIQQLGSGAVYCHLMDAAYPERISLSKVKWEAKLEIDFLYNFKILQTSFEVLNIQKHIQIEKLVKAKFQDNLEFVQWMHTSFAQLIDTNSDQYEPLVRRKYAKVNLDFLKSKNSKKVNLTLKENNKENLHGPKSSRKLNQTARSMRSSISSIYSNVPQQSTPLGSNKNIMNTSYSSTNFAKLEESIHQLQEEQMEGSKEMYKNMKKKLMPSKYQVKKKLSIIPIVSNQQINKLKKKKSVLGISVSSSLNQGNKISKNSNHNMEVKIAEVKVVESDEEQDPNAFF